MKEVRAKARGSVTPSEMKAHHAAFFKATSDARDLALLANLRAVELRSVLQARRDPIHGVVER